MRRAAWWFLLAAAACDPEPELAVAPASLLDDVPVELPEPPPAPPPLQEPTEAERRRQQKVAEINAQNALEKARELETVLGEEIRQLETRLQPVEVQIDE